MAPLMRNCNAGRQNARFRGRRRLECTL